MKATAFLLVAAFVLGFLFAADRNLPLAGAALMISASIIVAALIMRR